MKITMELTFKKIIHGLLIAVLVFSSIPILSTTAHAIEECDVAYYSSNDILFYNPCETCSTEGSKLLGSTNEERVFAWLTAEQQGFNAAQAAGIMGNINTESSFNPFRMQTTYSNSGIEAVLPVENHSEYNKAFGLIQWDGGRRQQIITQLQSKFPDFISDVNTYGKTSDGYKEAGTKNDAYLSFELTYMFQELSTGYTSVYDELKAQPDTEAGVVNATEIWNRKFEVSADYSQDRHNKAKEYYAQFKDAVTPVSAGGDCSSGEPAGEPVWYSQRDTRWATVGYAGSTIGNVGCGPAAMAIILAGLIDQNITPQDVAAVAGEQNGYTSSPANLIAGVTEKWPSAFISEPLNFEDAVDWVKSGKGYVWMGGVGDIPFTPGTGHMVAMVGVADDGKITIADPFGDAQGREKIADYPRAQIDAAGILYYGVSKQ